MHMTDELLKELLRVGGILPNNIPKNLNISGEHFPEIIQQLLTSRILSESLWLFVSTSLLILSAHFIFRYFKTYKDTEKSSDQREEDKVVCFFVLLASIVFLAFGFNSLIHLTHIKITPLAYLFEYVVGL